MNSGELLEFLAINRFEMVVLKWLNLYGPLTSDQIAEACKESESYMDDLLAFMKKYALVNINNGVWFTTVKVKTFLDRFDSFPMIISDEFIQQESPAPETQPRDAEDNIIMRAIRTIEKRGDSCAQEY